MFSFIKKKLFGIKDSIDKNSELIDKIKNRNKKDSGVRFSRSGKVYIDKLVFLQREEVIKDIEAIK